LLSHVSAAKGTARTQGALTRYHRGLKLKAIFFDAGNTLVFPDLRRTLAPLLDRGVEPSPEQLRAAEREARRRRDAAAADGHKLGDQHYWEVFCSGLLRQLAIDDRDASQRLLPALVAEARNSQNWDRVLPGTREALATLRSRYGLGVISNSDGSVEKLLERIGLGGCFDSVTDSGVIGHEKPDRRIFEAALTTMKASADESLYVGDIYSVDYLGAMNAGMRAMLFDVSGTYCGTDLPRVESMEELVAKLM